ncbi:hypothetical protein H1C71_002814, partial [Ictidomys tridecemlineatus]
ETLRMIEEKVGSDLHIVGSGSKFLNRTSIAQELMARINKWDLLKLKSFFTARETIREVNREPTSWEQIFTPHTSDRALIFRVYKELKKLDNKITNNPINKWAKDLNRHFSEEDIQSINKYMEKCSPSLAVTEMQIKTTLRYHLTPVRLA